MYSIWVCMDAPGKNRDGDAVADNIFQYSMEPKLLYCGDQEHPARPEKKKYDLMTAIFVCFSSKTLRSENQLIGLLSTVFSPSLSIDEKKTIIEEQFGLPLTNTHRQACGVV